MTDTPTPLTDAELDALRDHVSQEYRIADRVSFGSLLATIDALKAEVAELQETVTDRDGALDYILVQARSALAGNQTQYGALRTIRLNAEMKGKAPIQFFAEKEQSDD